MSRDLIRIGLIGTGRIGRLHAENFSRCIEGVRVVAVADKNLESAERCAAHCGVENVTGDYRALIARDDVDAVVVCSSTDTHATIVGKCAEAKKHVFCEKPLGSNAGEIDRALAAVDAAGVKLMVGFNRRFDANFARARRAIEEEIGELHLLHIVSRDPAPPPIAYIKVSGGIFMDMTIHDFDMARFLTGSEPVEIFVKAGVRVDPAIGEAGDVDTAVTVITFANGVIATIDNSRRAVYGYDQRVEAFGSGGSVQIGNNFPNAAVVHTAESVRRDLPLNFFMERYAESYITEMKSFLSSLRSDSPPPVTGADARSAYCMAVAAKMALAENRPVRMEEI